MSTTQRHHSTTSGSRPIELLAPARTADIAIEAVRHGADAVYIGGPAAGARAAAANTVSEIGRAARFAHLYGARIYAAVNTVLADSELEPTREMIWRMWEAGVDALIVQDMALLGMDLPPIPLHASTQCDITSVDKALWLQRAGFSQLVVARELTIGEMRRICEAVTVPVEAFVHGALCVSYSGACYASLATTGRSANRGECAQICRLPYTLTDGSGRELMREKHLLSLRDLNRIGSLKAMLDAGVSSFKIEGRLKDAAYVKNVVAAYRLALDSIIDAEPDRFVRSSQGAVRLSFVPELDRSFNRGFTSYFTDGVASPSRMACFDTPKWVGRPVGQVVRSTPGWIEVDTKAAIANGDGLGYFSEGSLRGFRVNRVEGSRIFPAAPLALKPGTCLYRNSDKAWEDTMARETARRVIPVRISLRRTPAGVAAWAQDDYGNYAGVNAVAELSPARSPQTARRHAEMSKTGDSEFEVKEVEDTLGELFVPASILSSLRRRLIESLRLSRSCARRTETRDTSHRHLPEISGPVTFRANVANSIASRLYTSAGASSVEQSLESGGAVPPGTVVMTTRYCLRRECGRCLRTAEGAGWKEPLEISSGGRSFGLRFDCKECRMEVISR